jgi:hypothetical protein
MYSGCYTANGIQYRETGWQARKRGLVGLSEENTWPNCRTAKSATSTRPHEYYIRFPCGEISEPF